MAAPKKLKLDYVSWDTDWSSDPLVLRLEMLFDGPIARFIFHDLANWGYKNNGYYFKYNEDEMAVFCHTHRYDLELTKKVIESACELGLFDKKKAVENSVLTSERMQKNFCEATKRRKLMYTEMEFMYTEIAKMYTTTTTNDTTTRQSKVKESKVKESEENDTHSDCGKLDIRALISDEFFNSLVTRYGQAATLSLISRMERYCQQHDKTYQNFEATLDDWALKDLKPIPSWTHCTNPECKHGIVYFIDELGEMKGEPCPVCKGKEVERGAP